MNERTIIRPGDRVTLELPYTEVCVHIGIAGEVHAVELVKHERPSLRHPSFSARVYLPKGGYATMLPCEAGIRWDAGVFYAYREGDDR